MALSTFDTSVTELWVSSSTSKDSRKPFGGWQLFLFILQSLSIELKAISNWSVDTAIEWEILFDIFNRMEMAGEGWNEYTAGWCYSLRLSHVVDIVGHVKLNRSSVNNYHQTYVIGWCHLQYTIGRQNVVESENEWPLKISVVSAEDRLKASGLVDKEG